MAIFSGYEPESPRWWLQYLVQKLIERQPRYDTLENYHLGNHPLPQVDPKHVAAVRVFQKMARANYVSLVNKACPDRMRVRDFTFGEGRDPDSDAKTVWSVNEMDLQSTKLHLAAAIFGDAYLVVGPPDEETGFPTMMVEDPRVAYVEPDPMFPMRSVAGIRMWCDVFTQKVVAVLYLPDAIYSFTGPSYVSETGAPVNISKRLLGHSLGGSSWEEIGYTPNPVGEVPLVHYEWQPDFGGLSLGASELVLHIQDRVNQMILDRLVIAKSQAFQQVYATGISEAITAGAGKKGPKAPPLELGANNLWAVDNPDAKFGHIPAVDFKQMLEGTRDDIADIAAIAQIPSHYLMGRMSNVSGDTLTQAESGFASMIRVRQKSIGWGHERAMRMAFKYMGLSKATEPEATVLWANPMVRKDVDAADAASKWVAAGVEVGLVMDELGNWSSEQIAFARENVQQQKDEAAAQMERQAQISTDNKAAAADGGQSNNAPSGRGN